MPTFPTRTRTAPRARGWVTKTVAASCLVAGLGFGAHAGAEELNAEQIAATLRDAKHIGISNVRYDIGGPPGSLQERDARWCRKFRLSPDQVRAFLRQAEPITPNEWHHGYLHFPCSANGTARVGKYKFRWWIEVIAVAHVSQEGNPEHLILACKANCKARKPFDAIAKYEDVVEDHEVKPAK